MARRSLGSLTMRRASASASAESSLPDRTAGSAKSTRAVPPTSAARLSPSFDKK
jgi:hypothetical protein